MPTQASTPTVATASAVTPIASLRRFVLSLTGGRVVHTGPSSSPACSDDRPQVARSASADCAASSSTASSVALVRMPPIEVSSRLRIATEDSSCGTTGPASCGAHDRAVRPLTGAARDGRGAAGSGQRPVSSRYRIAPRPLTSSRGTASGSGPGNASRSVPSGRDPDPLRVVDAEHEAGVVRALHGGGQRFEQPGGGRRPAAGARRSRPQVGARWTSPRRRCRAVPRPGATPLPRLSTSSTRAMPGWVNAGGVRGALEGPAGGLRAVGVAGSPTSTVSATSRRSWPSRARHRCAFSPLVDAELGEQPVAAVADDGAGQQEILPAALRRRGSTRRSVDSVRLVVTALSPPSAPVKQIAQTDTPYCRSERAYVSCAAFFPLVARYPRRTSRVIRCDAGLSSGTLNAASRPNVTTSVDQALRRSRATHAVRVSPPRRAATSPVSRPAPNASSDADDAGDDRSARSP